MTTTSYSGDLDHNRHGRGFFARIGSALRTAFDTLVEAREMQARALVRQHLLSMSDESLKACGYTREEVKDPNWVIKGPGHTDDSRA